MNLHFVTSLSQSYWQKTARKCLSTWDLPGKVTIYIDQEEGEVEWFNELPFYKRLLRVPDLPQQIDFLDRNKVRKFWGKSCAQIHAVINAEDDERIIWLDSDITQNKDVKKDLFNWQFEEEFAIMNSGDSVDCWESGIVIFNNQFEKIKVTMNRYRDAWQDKEFMQNLWKPYDAQVLGSIGVQRSFKNLCLRNCKNAEAVENTIYKGYFKHWINKENKSKL